MKYRITMQHLKSDSEQIIITTYASTDAKRLFSNSAENDYFSLLEQYKDGKWERVTFQIGQGDIEKELDYAINN